MRRINKIRERALYPPRHLVSRISFVPPKGVRLDRHKNIVLNLTFFGVGCVGRIWWKNLLKKNMIFSVQWDFDFHVGDVRRCQEGE